MFNFYIVLSMGKKIYKPAWRKFKKYAIFNRKKIKLYFELNGNLIIKDLKSINWNFSLRWKFKK